MLPGILTEDVVTRVRLDRILERLESLSRIGATPDGGVTRLAFTEGDSQARALVAEWMRDANLAVQITPIGNVIGHLESASQETQVVMTGSHTDTVYSAGRFDGTLGTIAALEAVQAIKESNIKLSHPIEVVCFMMEESARFGVGYAFGSKVMTGQSISDDALLARDRKHKTLVRAIHEMSNRDLSKPIKRQSTDQDLAFAQELIAKSRYPVERIKAFIELHIEQGPILELSKRSIGVVTAIAAPTRLRVTLTGEQNHSGTTPMSQRHDALAAAAEVILAVERIACATKDVVGTVGVIEAEPNSMTAIPGKARITIDLRSTQSDSKANAEHAIRSEVIRIAESRGIHTEIDILANELPQPLSEDVAHLIEQNSLNLGIEPLRLPSGAGHDAAQMAKVVRDTGMIFVPSRRGISHNPEEWTAEEDILKGTQVLLLTILALAT